MILRMTEVATEGTEVLLRSTESIFQFKKGQIKKTHKFMFLQVKISIIDFQYQSMIIQCKHFVAFYTFRNDYIYPDQSHTFRFFS